MYILFLDKDKNSAYSINCMLPITYKDTVPFIPPIQGGTVVKVYDGDTITIASRLPYDSSPMYRFSVRLTGIDCPEMKSRNEGERKLALHAANMLQDKIMGKYVELQNMGTEKYGRLLADVFLDGEHINEWILMNGFARPYSGGKKESFV